MTITTGSGETASCASAGCDPDRAGRVVPGLKLCLSCLRRLRHGLAGLPGHHLRCEDELVRRPGYRAERVRGGRPGAFQLDETVVRARSEAVEVLTSWSALVVQERRVSGPSRRDAASLAAFLLRQLEWLAAHQAAGDFADEIAALTKALREAAQPEPPARVPLGPCAGDGCEYQVYAEHGSSFQVRCEAGHVARPSQWLHHGVAVQGRTVPTRLAALAAGVDTATVRKWASRGKLTRYGPPGRAEYDLGELHALAGNRP